MEKNSLDNQFHKDKMFYEREIERTKITSDEFIKICKCFYIDKNVYPEYEKFYTNYKNSGKWLTFNNIEVAECIILKYAFPEGIKGIRLHHCKIEYIEFEYFKTETIHISFSEILNIKLRGVSILDNDGFHIIYSIFNNIKLLFYECDLIDIRNSYINLLDISNSNSKKKIAECTILELSIRDKNDLCDIELINCEISEWIVKDELINKDVIIKIVNCSFNSLKLISLINRGNLIITNLKPNNFGFKKDFVSYEFSNFTIYLYEIIKSNSSFSIIQTDLSVASFVNVNFNFDKFYCYDSKLIECTMIGCKHPLLVNSDYSDYRKTQITYGQLKKIYEKQGDWVVSNYYYERELNDYMKYLKKNNGKWWERLNLWLSNYTNSFGNDWLKALFLTLLISSILFAFYYISLNYRIIDNKTIMLKRININEVILYFPEIFNPLHKNDYLTTPLALKNNIASSLIDFLSRIIIGYLEYQLIQAFRKYGRR